MQATEISTDATAALRNVAPADLTVVRHSHDALRVLRRVIAEVRAEIRSRGDAVAHIGDVPAIEQFARGMPMADADVVELIGDEPLDLLEQATIVARGDGWVLPRAIVRFVRQLAVLYPLHQSGDDRDQVYFGVEAPWLMTLAWKHGRPGHRAADLATGTGAVAAALAARYDDVVATDISAAAVDCAAVTLELNRTARSTTRASIADVADGLPSGAFDLVVGNPPWVPTIDEDTTALNMLYGHGGRTGMELPARFVQESVRLLAPGGVGIQLVCDTTWNDGSRPLHDLIASLDDAPVDTLVEPAPDELWEQEYSDSLAQCVPGCLGGRLSAVVMRKHANA